MQSSVVAHASDRDYLIRQYMRTGYQISSALTPLGYTIFILAKRGQGAFSMNRLLRATWIGGLTGTLASGALAHLQYTYTSEKLVRTRRINIEYNADRIRAQDHAMIGTVLMGVVTPAFLWNRANIVNLILGGAGIGSSIGLLIYYGRNLPGDSLKRHWQ